jgi:hypothetical protein
LGYFWFNRCGGWGWGILIEGKKGKERREERNNLIRYAFGSKEWKGGEERYFNLLISIYQIHSIFNELIFELQKHRGYFPRSPTFFFYTSYYTCENIYLLFLNQSFMSFNYHFCLLKKPFLLYVNFNANFNLKLLYFNPNSNYNLKKL